ncbi:hypothetical protein CNMCM5793_001514 [Aspergillus hiratsukae]|uniref:Uncharacterized protein n=1 Tax=Aspergillus hiratsukae TaxID=1194566 RepID=A0A8H6PRL4_9EURO|nr:hypothetical protein CNMCM5793_001514 [Aspergillus hiratsukae]KAF7158839.1 hypothetical protein CNMCM6106_005714 [Aspergillus hiratsukae]
MPLMKAGMTRSMGASMTKGRVLSFNAFQEVYLRPGFAPKKNGICSHEPKDEGFGSRPGVVHNDTGSTLIHIVQDEVRAKRISVSVDSGLAGERDDSLGDESGESQSQQFCTDLAGSRISRTNSFTNLSGTAISPSGLAPRPRNALGNPAVNLLPNEVYNHLQDELGTPLLDGLYDKLWLFAKRSGLDVNTLHTQRVKGRHIIPTEDPRLHLVWD